MTPVKERPKKRSSLLEKMIAKLTANGVSKRKAEELAKQLAPVVKKEVRKELGIAPASKKPVETSTALTKTEDTVSGEKKSLAQKINGLVLRLDLPVLGSGRGGSFGDFPTDAQELEVFRVMNGWTTFKTYIVAAVKGEHGAVAIRNLGGYFNVKFYPDMTHWNVTQEQLSSLGANSGTFLKRAPYERMHLPAPALDQLLSRLEAEAKPKSRVKSIMDRFKAVNFQPLTKAFEFIGSSKFLN